MLLAVFLIIIPVFSWWNGNYLNKKNDTITANETFINFVYLLNSKAKASRRVESGESGDGG